MENKTIYVISGFMRTGTSMMMKCLEAGGMDATYNPDRDKMNKQFGDDDYQPNPGGFYELKREDYQEINFPQKFKGKLLKCLYGGLTKMVVGDYKVIFMKRDVEEIRQSFESFFNKPAPQLVQQPKKFNIVMQNAINMLNNRKDTEVAVFWYRKVVEDPIYYFKYLKNHGWPIDYKKAATIIDPELCRYKIEELTVGI